MTTLLDASALIALLDRDHTHHQPARRWFGSRRGEDFATCPVTQGALVRSALRSGRTAADALEVLSRLEGHPRHRFWPDDLSYRAVDLSGVVGHRQVTDAYLAGLARARDGRLATFDRGLAALHADVALLIEAD